MGVGSRFGHSAYPHAVAERQRKDPLFGASDSPPFCSAVLRVTSDLTGGTVFENIKTRTPHSALSQGNSSPLGIVKSIMREHGWKVLWKGSSTRMVGGSLIGAVLWQRRPSSNANSDNEAL